MAGGISRLDCRPLGMPPSRRPKRPGMQLSAALRAASLSLAPGPGARRRSPRVPRQARRLRRYQFAARTPPSYTTMSPSGRSGRDGTQSSATHPAHGAVQPKLLSDLPAASSLRRLLSLYRATRQIPGIPVHRVYEENPSPRVAAQSTCCHPLTGQRCHIHIWWHDTGLPGVPFTAQ